jgi:hypothetical protein
MTAPTTTTKPAALPDSDMQESIKTTFQTALNCAVPFSEGCRTLQSLLLGWVGKKFGAGTTNELETTYVVDNEEVGLSIQAGSAQWLFRCEHPDQAGYDRDWLTDVKLSMQGNVALLVVRNACRFSADDGPAFTTAPRFVSSWVKEITCRDGGESLEIDPHWVEDTDSLDRCLDLLETPTRRLPAVLVSPYGRTRDYAVNVAELASRLSGAAHVLGITDEMSYALSDEYGKYASVFNGGVHFYWPGFSPTVDSSHEMQRPPRLKNDQRAVHHSGFMRFVTERVLSRTPHWPELSQCVAEHLPPLA